MRAFAVALAFAAVASAHGDLPHEVIEFLEDPEDAIEDAVTDIWEDIECWWADRTPET